jgi:hypothetical protein
VSGQVPTGESDSRSKPQSLRRSHSEITPGNRRTVRRSWCAWLPATSARWSLARFGVWAGHSGSQGMNSRVPTMRVAPRRTMRQLEPCSRRRETARRWRKPSSWLSEKPVKVSIAGGNAVTAEGLSCYREPTRLPSPARDNLAKRVPVRNGDAKRGGGRRRGTTPGKVWTTS